MTAAHPTRRYLATAVLLGWLSLAPSPARAGLSDPPRFRVTDLGAFFPTAINAAGQVAGYTALRAPPRAVLYDGGRLRDLVGTPGSDSFADGINAAGQVVGSYAATYSGVTHAVLYSGGRMRDLGTPADASSYARAVNAGGQVVGVLGDRGPYGDHYAFLYDGGRMRNLGGSFSEARDINDAGQVVGFSSPDADASGHAFLYDGGRMRDLGTLPGGTASEATGINAAGQVVGSSDYAGGGYSHAFLYDGGRMRDLGTLPGGGDSFARDINDAGQVVGWSYGFSGRDRPFLYDRGRMYDLHDLLEPGSGWLLLPGPNICISDAGQIVGTATNPQGDYRAVLLTPVAGTGGGPPPHAVPLPPMVWGGLATLVGVGLVQVRRRRHAVS
jgi:probable HAF family extracellular repeat protein